MNKTFDFEFCTQDFDQEMLDFIEGSGYSVGGLSTGEWDLGHRTLYYGTGLESFWTDDDPDLDGFQLVTKEEFKRLIGMSVPKPTLYTQSELTEIEELQDRVQYLESLCEDYAKIISEKDAEIEQLKHSLLAKANNTCVGVEREAKPEGFKPVFDMTIEDWQQALYGGWVFETRCGVIVKVSEIDRYSEYPIEATNCLSYTTEGRWLVDREDKDDIIKRIK